MEIVLAVIPATLTVIPAPFTVIPAKAGIQSGARAKHAKQMLCASHACFTGFRLSPE
jgi:hypothetical protein